MFMVIDSVYFFACSLISVILQKIKENKLNIKWLKNII